MRLAAIGEQPAGRVELGQDQKEAWAAMLLCHAAMTRKIDKVLEKEGLLSLQVYDVLLALEDAPNGRMRMSDLAETVIFDASSLSRLVDRLCSQGLVRREACPNDRRSVLATITEEGLAARSATWPRYCQLVAEHFGVHVPSSTAKSMTKSLMKVMEKMGYKPLSRMSTIRNMRKPS